MTEDTGAKVPPTYFANIVTLHVTVDEITLELRRFVQPHKEILSGLKQPAAEPITLPTITPAKLFAEEPMARIVLTFSAAQDLKQNLDKMLPTFEQARRTGGSPWQQPRQ